MAPATADGGMTQKGISRRAFLKGIGAAGAALAVPPFISSLSRARGVDKIRHGIVTVRAESAFQLIVDRAGFTRQYGLDVEYIENPSGATVLRALIAGELDTVELAPSSALAAIEKGSDLKVIGAITPGMPYVLYTTADINSVEDLRGRRIGIAAPGGLAHVLALGLLEYANMRPSDVTLVNVGGDASRFAALVAGQVDATVTHIEYSKQIEGDPRYKILLSMRDVVPNYVRQTFITRGDVIRNRRDVLQRWALANTAGIRYAREHRAETVAIMSEIARQPAEEIGWVYDWFVENRLIEMNYYVPPESLQWMQEMNVSLQLQSRVLPSEQVGDWSFHEHVVQTLGRYDA